MSYDVNTEVVSEAWMQQVKFIYVNVISLLPFLLFIIRLKIEIFKSDFNDLIISRV